MVALPLRAGYRPAHSSGSALLPAVSMEFATKAKVQWSWTVCKNPAENCSQLWAHTSNHLPFTHFSSFLCQPWAKFHCHLGPWLDCFIQALDLPVTSHTYKHFIHEGKLPLFNILYQTGSNMFSPAGSMEEFTAEFSSSTTCVLKVACRAYKQFEMKGPSRRKAWSLQGRDEGQNCVYLKGFHDVISGEILYWHEHMSLLCEQECFVSFPELEINSYPEGRIKQGKFISG